MISVSKLVKNEYSVYFDGSVVIKDNKHFICSGTLVDDFFVLKSNVPELQLYELNNTNSLPIKRKQHSEINQTYLWHLRLGHINLNRIQRLVKNGPLDSLKVEALPTCDPV